MFLGRVIGNVWCTVKHSGLNGRKLMLVQPIKTDGSATGKRLICADAVGAGPGETIYWCRGKESSFPFLPDEVPTDATIVGIVDCIEA